VVTSVMTLAAACTVDGVPLDAGADHYVAPHADATFDADAAPVADSALSLDVPLAPDGKATADHSIPDLQASSPDLSITSFKVNVSGTTVTFTVTVCNSGTATNQTFYLGLWYDSAPPANCSNNVGNDFKASLTLAAGACTTQTFTRSSAPFGSFTAHAKVDPKCDISESNETNNTASASYTVAVTYPDLTVSSFTAQASGTTVTYSVTVCNSVGAAAASSFDLGLWYTASAAPSCTSSPDDKKTISGLAPGACATHTFTRTSAPPGTFTSWVLVDATCAVGESNETNNTMSTTYTQSCTGLPDLTVPAIKVSVSGSLGTKVTFDVTVCNEGGATTDSFFLGLWPNAASAPTCGSTAGSDKVISGLGACICTTETFTQTFGVTGSYKAWAMVDRTCTVTESDESNNISSASWWL